MKHLFIVISLFITFTELGHTQSHRSTEMYGEQGLKTTEKILSELDLPEWYWGGAHLYRNVQQYYRLVDAELLEKYLGIFPTRGNELIDPQNLLDDEQRKKVDKLLAAHDMKSALPIYVYVLAHGQKLSIQRSEMETRLSKLFRDKNAMVIFYYYGDARDASGYVLLDSQGLIDNWEVDELFLKSGRDASVQFGDFAELESFISEFSKRSYWLEQKLITPVIREKDSSDKENHIEDKSNGWDAGLGILKDHILTLIIVLGVLIGGAWYFLWSRRWREYVLPEGDVPVRLGAEHGSNVSDPIEFSDPKLSLSEQRRETKSREL